MRSMGREKGLARNQDLLEKYTPIPLATQGCEMKAQSVTRKAAGLCTREEILLLPGSFPLPREKQLAHCAQQERPSVGSLLNFQLAWPEPT